MLKQRIWRFLSHFGPYAPLVGMFIMGLLLLSLSRIGLMIWQWPRVAATAIWPQILLQGLRVDVIQLSLLCAIPVLFIPLLAIKKLWRSWQIFTLLWVIASITLLLFLEAATPGFIGEYEARPNRLFVVYLQYPKEVISMLWGGFRIHVLAGIVITALTIWLMYRFMQPWLQQANRWGKTGWSKLALLLSWPIVLLMLVIGVRSTIGHRPANPALFALTTDSMVNNLILNSTWSVVQAVYMLHKENISSEIYGKMTFDKILEITNAQRNNDAGTAPFLGDIQIPTLNHLIPSQTRAKPLNLVIVLEESLGATFVESLGGLPLTPELEKLKTQGWWFENLYATGTRSVRGIEAVITGFPPTPAESVVKLSRAQQGFFTLAELLKQQGYQTEFIYGGQSHFDSMRGFFMGNGFQTVTDQKDYINPEFVGSWGVSDEDLFNMAHTRIQTQHSAGQPFFTLVFSSSNHTPFEYPEGKIEPYEPTKATVNNAVKYADYALGKFFVQAQSSDYWSDTLFIIVADHDTRVHGDSLVPIKHFHIPGLILGADIQPRTITTVASQIDLPVTALSLMGIEANIPALGRDISKEPENTIGRAMMQFEQNYGWMEGNKVVVLREDKPAIYGSYNRTDKTLSLQPETEDTAMAERALANVLLPAGLYREQQYRLSAESVKTP